MYNNLGQAISSYYTFMESPTATPGIEHEFLWMVFKPGCLLFHTKKGIQTILRLLKTTKLRWSDWCIEAESFVYDGENFGKVIKRIYIRWYEGYKPLQELKVYPLQIHPRRDEILQSLAARGRKYVSLRDMSHRFYSGAVDSLSTIHTSDEDGLEYYTAQTIIVSHSRN